jgi:hypothetical protein
MFQYIFTYHYTYQFQVLLHLHNSPLLLIVRHIQVFIKNMVLFLIAYHQLDFFFLKNGQRLIQLQKYYSFFLNKSLIGFFFVPILGQLIQNTLK